MNLKGVTVVVALSLAMVFLLMDKCGNSRKADELKERYEEASQIAKVERLIKEEIIKEQEKRIEEQDLLIAEANKKVEIKESHISILGNTVTELEEEFGGLADKDAKIDNLMKQVEVWKEKFSLSQSIIADKDDIIFSLTAQYQAQLVISNAYKDMYDTLTLNMKKLESIVTAQDWQIKRLKLTGGLKTSIVLGLAGLIIFNMVK